jgi:hypothetical protein
MRRPLDRSLGTQPRAEEAASRAAIVPALVGREAELGRLRQRLGAARAGRGSLVLLAGEPGIGKTRLTAELASEARQTGVTVLWGRCWEGKGASKFWPWRQLLRSYGVASSPLTLRAELETGAVEILHLVPELAPPAFGGRERPEGAGGTLRWSRSDRES